MLRTGLAAAVFGVATPALANAVLPLTAIFGDPAGCAFFMTGQQRSDSFAVLTPDTLTTASSGCYFRELTEQVGNRYVVRATCSMIGEDSTEETVTVVDGGSEGLLVTVGEDSVTLLPCEGTEALFGPPGVQI